jgi:uracil-DNA glycosylase
VPVIPVWRWMRCLVLRRIDLPSSYGLQGVQGQMFPEGQQHAPALTAWEPQAWPVADDWRAVVDPFLASDVACELGRFIGQRLSSGAVIYPPQPFRALQLTALAQVKVLILGQDPYHGPGQAHGLAFSVAHGVKLPPSLRNIFKEVAADPVLPPRDSPARDGCLERWAQQGVLLLNTCLTVEQGQPASHAQHGWEVLTDAIVSAVAALSGPKVFLLWGAHAQSKAGLIDQAAGKAGLVGRHLVLSANHPSPLSALRPPTPFLGCGHFGKANAFLVQHSCSAIQW